MSSSTPSPKFKFLLDENVRIDLYKFLQSNGFDIKVAPKGASDSFLASLSKTEKRILITNDEDFADYSDDKIFSVVWLKIPQNNPKSLISSFTKLVNEFNKFSGRLVVLEAENWKDFPLPKDIYYKS